MATRQDIREAVYQEIKDAVDGLVDAAHVTHATAEETEALPKVVYNDLYRQIPMNNTTGVKEVLRNNGGAETYVYSRTMEAQFSVTIRSDDELEKESIYESLRRHFEQYVLPTADPSQIQSDVYRVTVEDALSDDDTDRTPVARGDTITVSVFFERLYEQPVDSVDNINHGIDADDDSVVEFTNTIN